MKKMVRVTGLDGSHAWINPERVIWLTPAVTLLMVFEICHTIREW